MQTCEIDKQHGDARWQGLMNDGKTVKIICSKCILDTRFWGVWPLPAVALRNTVATEPVATVGEEPRSDAAVEAEPVLTMPRRITGLWDLTNQFGVSVRIGHKDLAALVDIINGGAEDFKVTGSVVQGEFTYQGELIGKCTVKRRPGTVMPSAAKTARRDGKRK